MDIIGNDHLIRDEAALEAALIEGAQPAGPAT